MISLVLESSDFDADKFQLRRFRAKERMNAVYEIALEVLAIADDAPEMDGLAGAAVTVGLDLDGERRRSFHGLVTKVKEVAVQVSGHIVYELSVRPRLWLGSLVETLDIQLKRSVPEILEHKLGLIELAKGEDVRFNLGDHYPEREMVVQYEETDLAFVSRLCEKLGIFFFFAQEDKDVLIFGDDAAAFLPLREDLEVPFHYEGETAGVFELDVEQELIPSVYVCRDYYDQSPSLELHASHEIAEGFGGGVVEYGGSVLSPEEGQRYAKVRAEQRQSHRVVYRGRSTVVDFAPGHRFDLVDHPRHSRSLVLTEVEHQLNREGGGTGKDGEDVFYTNRFVAVPTDICYRPPRVTPVPRIHGVVSGVVETQQGMIQRHAQIDDQGRYTIRFLFDTSAPGEQKASCAVRMMQPSAGPRYGVHLPLKPGIEVAIAFLQGDPDRPVIMGAIPNPITPSPVDSSEASKSRIETRAGIVIEFEDADRGPL